MARRAAVAGAAALLLLAGCGGAAAEPSTKPSSSTSATSRTPGPVVPVPDDGAAPHLTTSTAPADEQTRDGDACARMGEGRSMLDDGSNRLPAQDTDALRLVFSAVTDVASAVGYREDDGDRVFFCTAFHLRDDDSGASSGSIPVPAADVVLTVAGSPSGYTPGENVADYYGWAAPDVATVVLRTPDGTSHVAAVEGNVWWAAPVLDDDVVARADEATWQALDASGRLLAEGGARRD